MSTGLRRWHLITLTALATLSTGCISLNIGKDTAQQAQYRIIDRETSAPAVRSSRHSLVVAPQPSAAVDDSFALAYSRAANQRAAYQFATWNDRPSNRLAQLLVDRLSARSTFTSVALLGRGVAGDLQLNLSVNDFYHDAAASPGTARVEVSAELIDRGPRTLLARRVFTATAPVEEANAAGAAAALSAASRDVLDQIVSWIETTSATSSLATAR
jgi:cholesterol transport system auxiliary component